MIYLTLLTTTCPKIHQTPCVLFETISHFSQQNSSVFLLAQTLNTFDKISPSKCRFSEIPLFALKFTKFLISFFKLKVRFFFKVWIIFQCCER